jgi:fatty-acyl-CoA synthase
MIRAEALQSFVKAVKGSGFSRDAFVPCYGMAEVGLAISFSVRDRGVCVDYVNRDHCVSGRQATRVDATNHAGVPVREFVDCGVPLPGIDVEVRDELGARCADRKIGTIWVRTDSVMEGYLEQPEATDEVLKSDGWLNTGDLGYLLDGHVFITGREKDIIIVGGKNFWPQDLEQVAERQPEVRTGGSMAFPMEDDDGREHAVLLVQCRERDADRRLQLKHRVQAQIKTEFSIDCHVELVDAHALPRTSSGKPSRSSAKRNYAAAKAANGNDDTVIIAAS